MDQTSANREVRTISVVVDFFDTEIPLIERTRQSLSFSRVAAANDLSRFVRPADLDAVLLGFKKGNNIN